MIARTVICDRCGGARWIVAHNGHPYHGTEGGGMPCPSCNDGDEPLGWRPTCLACVTIETFMAAYPDDEDIILARMEESLGDLDDPAGVVNVTMLRRGQLMGRKERLTRRLVELGELDGQRTREGADVHSELAAVVAEMRHRKML